jgi:hypothetical protein
MVFVPVFLVGVFGYLFLTGVLVDIAGRPSALRFGTPYEDNVHLVQEFPRRAFTGIFRLFRLVMIFEVHL